MPNGYRLGSLEMCVPRHRQLRVRLCLDGQSLNQPRQLVTEAAAGPSAVEAEVQGYLVVSGAAGVQTGARLRKELAETALNGCVDVLVRLTEDEAAVTDLFGHLSQSPLGVLELLLAQEARGVKGPGVSDRPGHVVGRQRYVHG
jgi:hypothetical protein